MVILCERALHDWCGEERRRLPAHSELGASERGAAVQASVGGRARATGATDVVESLPARPGDGLVGIAKDSSIDVLTVGPPRHHAHHPVGDVGRRDEGEALPDLPSEAMEECHR